MKVRVLERSFQGPQLFQHPLLEQHVLQPSASRSSVLCRAIEVLEMAVDLLDPQAEQGKSVIDALL